MNVTAQRESIARLIGQLQARVAQCDDVGELEGVANGLTMVLDVFDETRADPEPVSDAETYTIDDFRAFADRNDDRYNELWYGENSKGEPSPEDEKAAGIVSVVADDVFIVTPFFSSCGRESVDPVECYGLEGFAEWKTLARAAMDRGL